MLKEISRLRLFGLLGLFLLVLTGCTPGSATPGGADARGVVPEPEFMTPLAEVKRGGEGRVSIRLGAANMSHNWTREMEDFEARWQIISSEGELRAGGFMYHLGAFAPEESRYPLGWRGELLSGEYSLLWGAPELGSTRLDFRVERVGAAVDVFHGEARITDDFPPAYID